MTSIFSFHIRRMLSKPLFSKVLALAILPTMGGLSLSSYALEEYVTQIKPIYSAEFEQAYGGQDQMMAKMKVSYAMLNQALKNSSVSLRVNMLDPQQVEKIVNNPFTEFGLLWQRVNAGSVGKDYAASGADFLHYFHYSRGSGLAYVNGEYGVSGSVGDTVFRHEMGHNFGCKHEDGFQSAVGNTIMNGNSLNWYSNPNKKVNGIAQGDATHNCAGIIRNNRASFVARHKLKLRSFAFWHVLSKPTGFYVGLEDKSTNEPGSKITVASVAGSVNNVPSHKRWMTYSPNNNASFELSVQAPFDGEHFQSNFEMAPAQNSAGAKMVSVYKSGTYKIRELANGYQQIVNDANNLVLDLDNGSLVKDTQLIQWNSHGMATQQFSFEQAVF
jgi:hypothetical protein